MTEERWSAERCQGGERVMKKPRRQRIEGLLPPETGKKRNP
jgi:hypothetical protein